MERNGKDNKLLVLLIDGFRWDYFDIPELDLSGFKRLFKNGVKADSMIPDFPSLSFPNFHSIMTGLHVDDHGFVGNYMYDEDRNVSYEYKMVTAESNSSHWFEGAEPFWITAVKQGKRTYMIDWPGAHIPNKGLTSTFCDVMENWPFIPELVNNLRKAISFLKSDEIDMAGVYLNAVDRWGHSYGPNSKELLDILKQTDAAITVMMDDISTQGLTEHLNIVIFSDHGMTEISGSRTVDISHPIGDSVKVFRDKGAICSIWPKEGKLEEVYTSLQKMKNSHITVYKQDELPDRWLYKNAILVAPITVVADIGWYILTPDDQSIDCYLDGPARGYHGYDNMEKDMHGIFLAFGPDFKRDHKIGPVNAVDIYQVMCKALSIVPNQHKGNWSSVSEMFL